MAKLLFRSILDKPISVKHDEGVEFIYNAETGKTTARTYKIPQHSITPTAEPGVDVSQSWAKGK